MFSNLTVFAKSKKNLVILILSLFATAFALFCVANFIRQIEFREGFAFDDPLLSLFQPIDLTWWIFVFLYSSVLISIANLIEQPKLLVEGFFGYAILLFFRMTAMYLLPLNPPESTIPLKDPIIEYFGTNVTLTKDLFFSGHSSLMFFLLFLVTNKKLKAFLVISTIVVSLGVLIQHVHYTIDVFVAPFMAYTSYSFSRWFVSNILKM